ncbi:MAG: hypothetical protein QNK04_30375 [Myxococcota bacterium]|nr:hypothetical protein [Myxococcota bacterium]
MAVSSGLLTAANLLLAVAVGVRLLRLGWAERRLPELCLATFFLGTGFLATLLAVVPYGGVAQGVAGPNDVATRVLVGASHLGYGVGTAAVLARTGAFAWTAAESFLHWRFCRRGLTSVLAAVSFVTLALAFVATPAFKRWVMARAALQGA